MGGDGEPGLAAPARARAPTGPATTPAATPRAPRAVEVRRGPDGVWRSAAPGWRPLQASGLRRPRRPPRGADRRRRPVPRRGARLQPVRPDRRGHHGRRGRTPRWHTAWRDAQPWLRLGDGTRAQEVAALLDCFVPLGGAPTAHCSATRREAFGALLSSTPHSGLELAATLVHELQHAKLLALSELTMLHTADDTPGYWAPWRPDPRPFDGLFQGAYAHLALADFHLAVALTDTVPARRDAAWADHCRCRQQVEAALPALLGSNRLTPQGRTLVTAMAAHHTRPEGASRRPTATWPARRPTWRPHVSCGGANGRQTRRATRTRDHDGTSTGEQASVVSGAGHILSVRQDTTHAQRGRRSYGRRAEHRFSTAGRTNP